MKCDILDCAQEIFDRIECASIDYQPRLLEEISSTLGLKIHLDIEADENRYITKDLAKTINIMNPRDLQSVHVLIYGKEYFEKDVIPF